MATRTLPQAQTRSRLDELVAEAARLSRLAALSQRLRDDAYSAWTYFNNHRHQMDYPGGSFSRKFA